MRGADAAVAEATRSPQLAKAEGRASRVAPKAAYTVFIRDMQIETCVGAFAHERLRPTVLKMDIEMEVSCRAGTTDLLDDAVDYGAVVEDLRRCLAGKRYYLLEKVCEFAASRILDKFGALRVWVSVAKLGIIEGVGSVGVAVERRGANGECPIGNASTKSGRSRTSTP
jgi:FolB domain-containing protein